MEIEAKFIVPDAKTRRRLQKIQELAGYTLSASRVENVRDTYLDSAKRSILAAGYVCRRRSQSGKILITLKQIESQAKAVHRRDELEITLPSDQPPAQWQASPARDLVLPLVGDEPLAPLFHLRQRRTRRALFRDSQVVAELSLDNVFVAADGKTLAFLELEVELMPEGNEDDLAKIAKYIQDEWGLEPDLRTKFERALEFVNAQVAPSSTRPPKETKTKPARRRKKLKKPGIKIDDAMAEAARKTLLYQFQRMIEHEAGTRAGQDIEELHDMRVASRRMRAALTVCDDYLDADQYKSFSKSLRRTGRALGAVRDLDVFRVKTKLYLDQLPVERQNELAPLLAAWQIEYDRAREELLALFDSDGYQRFKLEFEEFLQVPGTGGAPIVADDGTPLPYRVRHVLPHIVLQCWGRVRSFDEWVTRAEAPLTHYHQLRIASKRLRYTLEFFQEILSEDTQPMIEKIKALQDHLGNLQDAAVACKVVQDFLMWGAFAKKKKRRVPAPTPVVALGVAAYLAARQMEIQELVKAFQPLWSEISDPEFNRRLGALVAAL